MQCRLLALLGIILLAYFTGLLGGFLTWFHYSDGASPYHKQAQVVLGGGRECLASPLYLCNGQQIEEAGSALTSPAKEAGGSVVGKGSCTPHLITWE